MERIFTFLDSGYSESEGLSWTTIKYKGKEYTAFTKIHKDDINKASKYAGCRFAEEKAKIKALKDELREEKIKCNACRDFLKSVMQYKNFDKNSPSAKAMFRQLNKRIKKVNNLIEEINEMIRDYDANIRQRDIVTAAIDRKKNNENG